LFLDKLGRCVMIYAGGQCVFQFRSPGKAALPLL